MKKITIRLMANIVERIAIIATPVVVSWFSKKKRKKKKKLLSIVGLKMQILWYKRVLEIISLIN